MTTCCGARYMTKNYDLLPMFPTNMYQDVQRSAIGNSRLLEASKMPIGRSMDPVWCIHSGYSLVMRIICSYTQQYGGISQTVVREIIRI